MLLPLLCMPFFKKNEISTPRIAQFIKTLNAHAVQLFLPTDLFISSDATYRPPYTLISPSDIQTDNNIVTIGPDTVRVLMQHIDTAQSIIINGLVGFLEIPK